MFGWLRRRVDREHCQLIYQNYAAASDTENKLYLLLHGDDPAPLEAFLEIADCHRQNLRLGKRLSSVDIEQALDINKILRRIFDNGRRDRGSFDQAYAPLGGWKMYFERNGTVP